MKGKKHGTDNDPYLGWHLDEGERGREVWYSLVTHPERPLAFWYRYTLLSTQGGHQEGRLWAGLTDGDDPERSFLTTRRYSPDEVDVGTPLELDYGGDASLTSDSAEGSIDSPVGDVSWDLSYEPDDVTFTPLRSRRITDIAVALLGAGRHWSFNESVGMDGTLELGDETVELEGAPGHQGHTVGTNVPESWSWVHCNSFDDETAVLEALEIEGKLSVCFRHDGEVHMINRLHHVVGPLFNKSTANDVGEWRFLAKGDGVKLEAEVSVEPGKWRHAAYLTPDDTTRYVAHCSLADIRVKYQVKQGGDWSEPRVVESNAGRAEWSDVTPPAGDEDDYVPEEFVG